MNRYKPTGWRYESQRHSLAAKGIKTRNFSLAGKPTKDEFSDFYLEAFGRKPADIGYDRHYTAEWRERFSSPKKAWSNSDLTRRAILKKKFPDTFGDLNVNANLNNEEYEGKFDSW